MGERARPNRFAFVIHPLTVADLGRHPALRWTRRLPPAFLERSAAWMPPLRLSTIRGVRSPVTGQPVEGQLYTLWLTPRQMLALPPRHTYDQLGRVARRASRGGAGVLGLGAFTSIVGDAGVTVAREAPLAVTSGNSLTVAMTLEAAKVAVRRMGKTDLSRGRAMVIGATGSIGAVCSRLLAQAVRDVVLVSVEPDRLAALRSLIEAETPGARVEVATSSAAALGGCDLVVTATSAFGQRVIDLDRCAPGAVVCDVARPCDVTAEEAAARPDVLVIEAGEVLLPGEPDLGFDIGLPRGVAYACLAETALLAMAGRFECFSLGRELSVERVKEVYGLSREHGLRLAGLRSFGRPVSEQDLAARRALATRLRRDLGLLAEVQARARERLAVLPGRSKGVVAPRPAAGAALH